MEENKEAVAEERPQPAVGTTAGKRKLIVSVLIASLVLAVGGAGFLCIRLLGGKDPGPAGSEPESVESAESEESEESVIIQAEALVFDSDSYSVKVGKTLGASVSVLPANATENQLRFSTGNPEVATVDENGVITGVSEGETTLIVTVGHLTSVKKIYVTATVWISMPQEYYAWNKDASSMSSKSEGWVCEPILDPDIADWTLSFSTGSPDVATVDENGRVVCCGLGSTVLTATVSNGSVSYSARMPLYVNGYLLKIDGVNYSHEGAGLSTVPTFFYGCSCETTGGTNVIAYYGSITRYRNGKVDSFALDDPNAPELRLSSGSDYFTPYGKGYVRLTGKAESITEYTALSPSFEVADSEGLQTLGDKRSFTCALEPTGFKVNGGGSNVYSVSAAGLNEYKVFVMKNKTASTVSFNMNVAAADLSVPSRTDEITSLSASNRQIGFTPLKASTSSMETSVVAYTAGGQKITLHIFLAAVGSPLSFVPGDRISLERGETFDAGVTLDQDLAAAYGGVKLSYSSENPEIASISDSGRITYGQIGFTRVRIRAEYGGNVENKVYDVYCNGYELSVSIGDNRVVYYGSEDSRLRYTVTLMRYQDGSRIGQGSITPSALTVSDSVTNNYLYYNDKYIYAIKSPEQYVDEEVRFRYRMPEGYDIYSPFFTVTVEPPFIRPSCASSNIGFNGSYFNVYDPTQTIQLKSYDCEFRSASIVSGKDAVKNFTVSEYGISFNLDGCFPSPIDEIRITIYSIGGQSYTAVFRPKL